MAHAPVPEFRRLHAPWPVRSVDLAAVPPQLLAASAISSPAKRSARSRSLRRASFLIRQQPFGQKTLQTV